MNPDECREAFEAWLDLEITPEEEAFRSHYELAGYGDVAMGFLGGLSLRTESKPVTREEIEGLRVWWVDGQLLYDGIEDETYRDSDHSEEVAVVVLKDLKKPLQLPAQQSPTVTDAQSNVRALFDQAEAENWVDGKLIEAIGELFITAQQSPTPGLTSQDIQTLMVKWAKSQGFDTWLGGHRAVMRNFAAWLEKNLPAPQSPVVPGVKKLDQLYDEMMLATDANASTVIEWAHRIKAIHAHLLATIPQSATVAPSVETFLSEVRAMLVEPKQQAWDRWSVKLDKIMGIIRNVVKDHAHLLATGGRESREDRYREALERIALYKAFNGDDWPAREALEALGTIQPKVVRGIIS